MDKCGFYCVYIILSDSTAKGGGISELLSIYPQLQLFVLWFLTEKPSLCPILIMSTFDKRGGF